jgi:phosphoesterase RecJ-like protein
VINVGLDIILNKIKQYDKIIIHGHIRPDGDCYGAQFGLKDLILSSFPKKKVYVVGETSEYPCKIRFLQHPRDDHLLDTTYYYNYQIHLIVLVC